MNVDYVSIQITISVRKVVNRAVLVHEVPIAQIKFGEANVKLSDRQVDGSRAIEDWSSEFNRCEKAWGRVSKEPDAISNTMALFGNPKTSGVDEMKKASQRPVEDLFEGVLELPEKEVAQTNDQATAKVLARSAPKAGINLKTKEMKTALKDLEIDFDESLKSKALLSFGKSALEAKANELNLDIAGMGTSDIFDAIVEHG